MLTVLDVQLEGVVRVENDDERSKRDNATRDSGLPSDIEVDVELSLTVLPNHASHKRVIDNSLTIPGNIP